MNKKMIKALVSIANSLDAKGLIKEADEVDKLIRSASLSNSELGNSARLTLDTMLGARNFTGVRDLLNELYAKTKGHEVAPAQLLGLPWWTFSKLETALDNLEEALAKGTDEQKRLAKVEMERMCKLITTKPDEPKDKPKHDDNRFKGEDFSWSTGRFK
jgi:hypothetical protein